MSRNDTGEKRRGTDSVDDETASSGDVSRRSMLMAVGAGSSLSFSRRFGGIGSRSGGSRREVDDANQTEQECPPCIYPYSGYLAVSESGEQGPPENLSPTVTVDLRVEDADVVFVESDEETGTADDAETTPAETMATETTSAEMMVTETTPEETMATETATGAETTAPGEPGGEGGAFPDFFFDPVGVRLRPGDTVEFVTRQDFHTVTAYHPRFFGWQRRVPEDVPGFTSPPFLEGDSWYYRFDEPGVYDVLCLPHEELGMVMRLVVVEEGTEEVPEAYPQPGPNETGPSPIAQTVLNAPELEPENIVEQETVDWTELTNVESEPPFGP